MLKVNVLSFRDKGSRREKIEKRFTKVSSISIHKIVFVSYVDVSYYYRSLSQMVDRKNTLHARNFLKINRMRFSTTTKWQVEERLKIKKCGAKVYNTNQGIRSRGTCRNV